ncbi:hypothetical protein CBOM_01568 [Ceraceosorus bombacis]|uniref:Uncharacterized protein n=1 Tax=Ceraceosorus bombacis TaxID=401625 RepID=A0A0P1BD13_9BASI|nr:hypothetical protein CBOM_01568 [Ceraceosorus bombacis]
MTSEDLLPSGLTVDSVAFVWLLSVGEGCLLTLPDYNVHVEIYPGEIVFVRRDVKFSTQRHPNKDFNPGNDYVVVVGTCDCYCLSDIESNKDPKLPDEGSEARATEARDASKDVRLTPRKAKGDPDPDDLLDQGHLPDNGGKEDQLEEEDDEDDAEEA